MSLRLKATGLQSLVLPAQQYQQQQQLQMKAALEQFHGKEKNTIDSNSHIRRLKKSLKANSIINSSNNSNNLQMFGLISKSILKSRRRRSKKNAENSPRLKNGDFCHQIKSKLEEVTEEMSDFEVYDKKRDSPNAFAQSSALGIMQDEEFAKMVFEQRVQDEEKKNLKKNEVSVAADVTMDPQEIQENQDNQDNLENLSISQLPQQRSDNSVLQESEFFYQYTFTNNNLNTSLDACQRSTTEIQELCDIFNEAEVNKQNPAKLFQLIMQIKDILMPPIRLDDTMLMVGMGEETLSDIQQQF